MNELEQLRARLAALEQENGLLREGVQQSTRMRRFWEQAIEELRATKQQLERSNVQLATLHQVGSVIHQTLDLQLLFEHIMSVMESALGVAQGWPMGVFVIEDNRMRLAASRGTDEVFSAAHRNLRVGDCLCGLAAAEGQIVLSSDCRNDRRHTLDYRCDKPHGHVIVPLLSRGVTAGVFFYYVPPNTDLDPSQRETFTAIGQQLGMAIENARLYEETRSLSLKDALTGLGNRRRMERVLDGELTRVARYRRPLSVLLVDIDYFKHYNDTHGHLEGDQLLVEIGALLKNETRENDLAVRYGGEEFLLVLPETPLAGAVTMAERLRQRVAERTPVTISVGVATAVPEHTQRDALLGAADLALYQAKQQGRNRVESAPAF